MVGGTVSFVSPPPGPAVQYSSLATARNSGAGVGMIARTPPEFIDSEGACEGHEREIKRIDAAGRIGGTSRKMERLREQRRYHKEEMWRQGCGR